LEDRGASLLTPDVALASTGHNIDKYHLDTNGTLRLSGYASMASFSAMNTKTPEGGDDSMNGIAARVSK
jgi:hypothetical protein